MPGDCRCRKNGLMAKAAVCSSEELQLGLYLRGKILKPDFADGKLVLWYLC